MTYVMSDIHGCYDKYTEMLEKIGFSEDDSLYVLGDICDRGPDSAKIYLDMMKRSNVFPIKGNHEKMAEPYLGNLFLSDGKINRAGLEELNALIWIENGGDATIVSLMNCSEEDRNRVTGYIKKMPYYRTVTVGDTEYVLVHAGLENFHPDKPLEEYTVSELVWESPDFDYCFFGGEKKRLLVGHTPTPLIAGESVIYVGKGDVIALDCGAVFGKRLGCLCLDTMEEFYV